MKPLPTDPAFCIIAPTHYLQHYATQSQRHLVLAHLVAQDPSYAEFYRQRSEAGDFIIMDNGAFELGSSYVPEELIRLGLLCGADALVLPDYPFQKTSVTVEAAEKWAGMVKDAGFYTMFVPQSMTGEKDDWMSGYVWAGHNGDIDIIGMSILGIPNAIPHVPKSYARVVMTEILIEQGLFAHHKYHHYLGLNAGPALEIPPLLARGVLNSLDSSGPVWMAILGHEYTRNADSYMMVSKVKKEVEFDFPFIKDMPTHRRIQTNLDLTLELFK